MSQEHLHKHADIILSEDLHVIAFYWRKVSENIPGYLRKEENQGSQPWLKQLLQKQC